MMLRKLLLLAMTGMIVWGCSPPAPRAEKTDGQAQKSAAAAPPLKVAEWIKGQPVTLAEGQGKNVYLVEFWATWCPPCRKSIPHLTELQKKYQDKGLVIIGVSNEDKATVREFVDKMGDKMDYRVAIDQDDATSKAYMQANNINTIPHAFLVDKSGQVVWNGNPLGEELDAQLEKALK